MLYLGPDTGLGLLKLLRHHPHWRTLVHDFALARHHGNVPVHIRVSGLDFAFLNTQVALVGKDNVFLAVQQGMGLCDVMHVGCLGRHAVHQIRVRIHTGMRLHALVPLLALFGLVHL